MLDLEEAIIRRWSGRRIMTVSALVGAGGILPLLLYVLFGPADGNPIGLGLLAVLCTPIAVAGVCVGLIVMLVDGLGRRRK